MMCILAEHPRAYPQGVWDARGAHARAGNPQRAVANGRLLPRGGPRQGVRHAAPHVRGRRGAGRPVRHQRRCAPRRAGPPPRVSAPSARRWVCFGRCGHPGATVVCFAPVQKGSAATLARPGTARSARATQAARSRRVSDLNPAPARRHAAAVRAGRLALCVCDPGRDQRVHRRRQLLLLGRPALPARRRAARQRRGQGGGVARERAGGHALGAVRADVPHRGVPGAALAQVRVGLQACATLPLTLLPPSCRSAPRVSH